MSEIILFKGFSKNQISSGKNVLAGKIDNHENITLVSVSEDMKNRNVEVLLDMILEDSTKHDYSALNEDNEEKNKVVIMAVASQERAFSVMRAYKSILDKPADAAFAMVTQNSLEWTLDYYIKHVSKEHEYMKTHDPSKNKDMKQVR